MPMKISSKSVELTRTVAALARAVATGATLAALVSPASATSADPSGDASIADKRAQIATSRVADRFKGYMGKSVEKHGRLAVSSEPDRLVTVVVTMASDPVAAVRALRTDHVISADEHLAIHQQLEREQNDIEPSIVARGGNVLAHFHDAINGIKIQIASSEVEGLKALPGVISVLPVATYHLTNAESVPFIGTPAVWQGTPGFKGEHVKIAIVDTGIDYTHANFGGPGTVAAFKAAAARSTQPADPALFGPKAPKVKGGIDLVGDAYDATVATSVPKPDPNPLDCEGHGSHVSGTAAGFGVGTNGATYRGPYDAASYREQFAIGPGVAPLADLYAVRVFGCTGSTNVVVDAIDWAVHNDMDVISMSLGSDFGLVDTADALAVKTATLAGILVAAASGNSGPAPYLTSTPASGQGAMAVAAMDSHRSFPGVAITVSTSVKVSSGSNVEAIDANGAKLPGPLEIVVLRTTAGAISLGCDEKEYADKKVAGKLVVTMRGTCARILRAQLGQKHGAAAVAMVNSSAGFPPYEGPIPGATIPFLGVLETDAKVLLAGAEATKFTANTIANPTFKTAASFSSGGPRFGDSALRPNLAAPGVSVFSTLSGSGNGGTYESGTSMATPHVAGVAALVREAHPQWSGEAQRQAVVETSDPAQLLDYAPRIEGAGLVQPLPATRTEAIAINNGGQHDGIGKGFFFGFDEFANDYTSTREMTVRNYGRSRIDFNLTQKAVGGSPHTAQLSPSRLSVEGGTSVKFELTLKVPVATVGTTHDTQGNDAFQEVAGYVTLTPADASMNNGVALHIPYYLVPRARSNVFAFLPNAPTLGQPTQELLLGNFAGPITGNADFYAWGLSGKPQGLQFFDTRAVGVQSNIISPTDSVLVFAVNTYTRFSSVDPAEFDILIDVNNDGVPDFVLASTDEGNFLSGTNNGVPITVLVNLKTNVALAEFPVDSPTDGSTLLMPVLASDLGVTPSHPRFSYKEKTTNNLDGTQSSMPGSASFNAFTPAITNALFVPIAPDQAGEVPVSINTTEWKKTPARGLMIVVQDNFSGSGQAQLLPVQ